jgi:hypothetical protein
MNGTLLAEIAGAASERFQAGTGGLLGGCSRSALRSVGSMVWKIIWGLHNFVDNAFPRDGNRDQRETSSSSCIQQEVLCRIWTIVLVVLASLVAEWVSATYAKAAP